MALTRITQRSMTTTSLAGLQGNQSRLQTLQQQLSSGRALSRPSDSPTGAVTALKIRSDSQRVSQYSRNASDGLARLGAADGAITSGLALVDRLRVLVVQARSGAMDASAREALANEVDSVQAGLVAVANTTYLQQPLFAGTAPVTAAYGASDGSGTFVPTLYNGNGSAVSRTIAEGTTVEVSVSGDKVFGSGGPDDLFATAAGIAQDLRTNPTGLGDRLAALDRGRVAMQSALSVVGARYNRIETAKTAADSRSVDLRGALAEVEDIDVPKTIMDLQMQQVAYQAALGATAKVLQPTLMDFLR